MMKTAALTTDAAMANGLLHAVETTWTMVWPCKKKSKRLVWQLPNGSQGPRATERMPFSAAPLREPYCRTFDNAAARSMMGMMIWRNAAFESLNGLGRWFGRRQWI